MPSNYKTLNPDYDSEDPASSQYIDLDDRFIDDAWILERFVGNNLFAWGGNGYGGLGVGDITHRSSPVQVGSLTNWKQVSADTHSAAVKTDGTLWTWGRNRLGSGSLGLGDTTDRSSPVQVGSLTNWKQVDVGFRFTAAVKTDGTLWTWGVNSGELGQNNTTGYSSPVQVGLLTNWRQVSAGNQHTAAIKTDGTLWTWGLNTSGQLGLGDTTHRSSPVQVGSLTNWKQVSCQDMIAAVKTDGTLWTLGGNGTLLGQNNTTTKSSPVQIGSLTNWKMVAAGTYAMVAIKTDGTIWSWGQNQNGDLGLGDRTHRSSPVQVGALTNWKQVDSGRCVLATKTDGTLWGWGRNQSGVLGQGSVTPISFSSPVQVGSLTNWKQISTGDEYHALAVTYTEIS